VQHCAACPSRTWPLPSGLRCSHAAVLVVHVLQGQALIHAWDTRTHSSRTPCGKHQCLHCELGAQEATWRCHRALLTPHSPKEQPCTRQQWSGRWGTGGSQSSAAQLYMAMPCPCASIWVCIRDVFPNLHACSCLLSSAGSTRTSVLLLQSCDACACQLELQSTSVGHSWNHVIVDDTC
jgi:hypothetical protein